MHIKATYRSETRKFSITTADSAYPTWEQLYNQLYRVFPISSNIYLSMMLFSPDASRSSRVLVGREVHTAEQYKNCMDFLPPSHTWKNPLLRFSVFDETPHKSAMHPHLQQQLDHMSIPPSHIPPPPVIYPILPMTNAMSMEVDAPQASSTPLSQFRIMQPQQTGNAPSHCCGAASAEVSQLINDFKVELDKVLDARFSRPGTPPVVVVPPTPNSQPPFVPQSSGMCLSGKFGCTGAGLQCVNCDLPRCAECPAKSWTACSGGALHLFRPLVPSTAQQTFPGAYAPGYIHSAGPSAVEEPSPPVHANVRCDQCDMTVVGTRHKCLDCADYDLCDRCMDSGGAQRHNPFHEFLGIQEPGRIIVHHVYDDTSRAATPVPTPPAPAAEEPVSHLASCDMCDSAIQGVRYKCLECPDYDTCSSCFSITKDQHPHSFAKMTKREDFIQRKPAHITRHWATCDACKKTIYGVRYKCMHPDCPDFDLCANCEAHPMPVHDPRHALLKMRFPDALIPSIPSTPISIIAPTAPLAPLIVDVSEREVIPTNPPTAAISEPIANEDVWERFDREAREEADRRRALKEAHDQQMEELREELALRTQQERRRLEEEERRRERSFASPPASLVELLNGDLSGLEIPSPQLGVFAPSEQGSEKAPSEASAVVIEPTESMISDKVSVQDAEEASPVVLSSRLIAPSSESSVFPPGAEFVKSWRIMNDGTAAWPDNTRLVVVEAEGEHSLGFTEPVHVGGVPVNAVTEISTGELKAPEVAGSIKMHFQLSDGKPFGEKLPFEITVAEATGEELSSSSIIIMPASVASTSASRTVISLDSAGRTVLSIPDSRSTFSLESISLPSDDDGSSHYASPIGTGAGEGERGGEYVVLYGSDSE